MRLLLAAVFVLPTLVLAQAPALPGGGPPAIPRVFVILDSSTSMKEAPNHQAAPWTYDDVKDQDTAVGDPSGAADCQNKFCVAKKTVYEVLQNFPPTDISLGMGTYYQYLLQVTPPDTRKTQCSYDVTWKAGSTLYFPANGAYEFEIDTKLTSTSQVNLANKTSPSGARSNQFYCDAATSDTTYDLTLQTNPATPFSCAVHNYVTSPGAPGSSLTVPANPPNSGQCHANKAYEIIGTTTEDMATYVWRAPTGPNACENYANMGDYANPLVQKIVKPGQNSDECTTANQKSCWVAPLPFVSGNPASDCSLGAPCVMLSSASAKTGMPVTFKNETIGFFGGSCNGGNQPTAPNAGDNSATYNVCPNLWSTANQSTFYDATRTEVGSGTSIWTTNSNTNNCQNLIVGDTVRAMVGGIGGNANTDYATVGTVAAALGGAVPTSGFTQIYMPSIPTSNLNQVCSSSWPCDVKLTANDPAPPSYSGWSTVNKCIANPPTVECEGNITTVRRELLKTGASCPSLGVETSTPPGTWKTSPNCGTGTNACTFNAQPEVVAPFPGGTCSASKDTWNGSTPAACSYGGITSPYSAAGTTVFNAYVDQAQTASCSATSASGSFVGATPAEDTQLTACRASGACPVSNGTAAVSPQMETTTPTTTSLTPPDATWSGQTDNTTGTEWSNGPCSGTNNTIVMRGGHLVRIILGAGPGYTSFYGTAGDGTQLFKCKFETISRTWSRPMRRCSYTFTRSSFTNPASLTWCQYDLNRERTRTVTPQRSCTYELKVRRFQFAPPNYTLCTYRRMTTTLRRSADGFRYSYPANGNEYVGQWNKVIDNHKCGAAPLSECPGSVDGCLGPNTMCYLRANAANAPQYGVGSISTTADGRFATIIGGALTAGKFASNTYGTPSATSNHVGVNGTTSGKACQLLGVTPGMPATPNASAYCVQNSNGPPAVGYQLVNDYMSCTDPNNPASCVNNALSDLTNDPRTDTYSLKPGFGWMTDRNTAIPPGSTYQWSNTATKAQGLSVKGVNHDVPATVLMDLPGDAVDNRGQFKSLLSKCIRPLPGSVSWPTWSPAGGICMPDTGAPTTAPGFNADYTPLWGSLSTVRQYLQQKVEDDAKGSCRPYYVVLATDGKENTPAAKTQSDLESAVTALRSVTGGTHTTDVKTFVLGIGDGAAGAATSSLNGMAIAGGTDQAYFAADANSLKTQLNQIFRRILAGSFSRSKPAIATDGKTIYAAYFDRLALEWVGHFTAYKINPDNTVTPKWELGQPGEGTYLGLKSKLDDYMADSDRRLFTDVSSGREAFTESNVSAFQSQVTVNSPNTITQLVRFIRNGSKAEPFDVTPGPAPVRKSRLNAIVQSGAAPVDNLNRPTIWGGANGSASYNSYDLYKTSVATRETQVLIGASDGLLRSVRDNSNVTANPSCSASPGGPVCPDGRENWGWVPSAVHPSIHNFLTGYTPGVDGQIATEDVCKNGGDAENCGLTDWKTIAVASMGGGGRGLVALDISKPNDPAYPKFLWSLARSGNNGGDLGYAPAPAIGRAEISNKGRFVAIVAGGRNDVGTYGSLGQSNGDEVYVLDAVSGNQIAFFDPSLCYFCDLRQNDRDGLSNQFAARPSYFRRSESSNMEEAFLSATNGRLYAMRMRGRLHNGGGTPTSNPRPPTQWDPKIFFEPTPNDFFQTQRRWHRDVEDRDVYVKRVKLDTADGRYKALASNCVDDGNPFTPRTCGRLPLPPERAMPFWLRARLATVYDPDDVNQVDAFLVTGNVLRPDNPDLTNLRDSWNYVYAVHDMQRNDDGDHDGYPMWVSQLLEESEQIVSEPTMVNGNLIVVSYLPPSPTAGCNLSGDATFYCFDPKTGDTKDCFVLSNNTSSAVVKYANVGIPSDPIVVNGTLYWTSSTTGIPGTGAGGASGGSDVIHSTTVASTVSGGRVRSFRRVR